MQIVMAKIVILGGSGQVGRILARHFHARGDAVTVFNRKPPPAAWQVELEQSDVCINLAGRSVNCRYTAANRRAIYDSRVLTHVCWVR
jgi:NAD dependent epimerase/dehydratase family enzyme